MRLIPDSLREPVAQFEGVGTRLPKPGRLGIQETSARTRDVKLIRHIPNTEEQPPISSGSLKACPCVQKMVGVYSALVVGTGEVSSPVGEVAVNHDTTCLAKPLPVIDSKIVLDIRSTPYLVAIIMDACPPAVSVFIEPCLRQSQTRLDGKPGQRQN